MDRKELRAKWEELHNNELARVNLRPEIIDSWERSLQYRVDPRLKANPNVLSDEDYSRHCENASRLIEASLPVMNTLSEFVAGTGFIVLLTDAHHCLLKIVGDDETVRWAQRGLMVEGSLWSEEQVGTNGSALAIVLARPISVHGYEHFTLFSHMATSSFAPIIDQGKVIGSLGIVASHEKASHHSLGMVVASAMHIKSKLTLERTNHYHEVVMESMSEGVMVVNYNGIITYMNGNCARFLKQQNRNVVGRHIYDLLGNSPDNQYFINTVTQGRVLTDETVLLVLGKDKVQCNITCNPLNNPDPSEAGTVVIIRESQRINRLVRNWIGGGAKMTFNDVVGNSTKFQQIINIAKAAASSSSNVLLLGESGTGKDIIAQSMHNSSPRRSNPFLAINCAALPKELIASELFGYEEGAFTGAKKGGNIGKFELADQGTIFLDEIGDMPLDLQASLLRVLEEKSVLRLGGNKLIPVNVRIIAATNKDLDAEIARNRFRRDLYYRLGVIRITIPPLRERPDDIILLANYLTEMICKRINKKVMNLSPEVIDAFLDFPWPGNVREMQNVLEGAIQLTDQVTVTYDLISDYFTQQQTNIIKAQVAEQQDNLTISAIEKKMIQHYLEKYKYNKTKTAKALGMSRRTLYRRLTDYNLM
ncbi:MAG: sigma 54-interacting transcriptional regulator [Syntrophomonadaceae bacterium]|nr:sigma 54-interacting transcriptional regulator [Syntrophomonadaceae bacterium]